jgi:hypothetical protein
MSYNVVSSKYCLGALLYSYTYRKSKHWYVIIWFVAYIYLLIPYTTAQQSKL